uniref:Spectrin repeat containing nuclear envelope family member 4 n=1 Tax=Spermophilus dauricus TaxID=99837 RepID=A0A8C9PKU1_SPEDA
MSLSPPRLPSEPLNHPPGAPREPDIAGCFVCLASGEETIRWGLGPRNGLWCRESSRKQQLAEGWRFYLDWPTDPGSAPCVPQHPGSGLEALEAEQDSLHLCLLGLGLQLQDLEQGLGPWTLAQRRMVQLQVGEAERVDALLTFGEGLAQRSEPRAWASLEQILRALGLQAQLASYSLVFEKANMPDQDLEVEGDLDGPGPDGASGPWAPSNLPTPAELEWDPAGDVGELGPSKQKTTQTPGPLCELCGHRGLQGRGQSLEVRAVPLEGSPTLPGTPRTPFDKKRQTSPRLQDVMLEVDPRASAPASRWPLTFLLILFFFLLMGVTLFLPISGGPCCSHARQARMPHLMLSYVNGLPPI